MVAARDISEFLPHLYDKGELDTNFQRIDVTILYHAPARSSPRIGKAGDEPASLTPGVTGDSEQPCFRGIAGTHGMKKEVRDRPGCGRPVFDFIKHIKRQLAACDTRSCRWAAASSPRANVVHPIWLIHKAYGPPNG